MSTPETRIAAATTQLYAEVERAAGAVDRAGAVGLAPLTEALLDYLDAMAAEDPALTHPHARPAMRSVANTARAGFAALLPHTTPNLRCELPLLSITLATPPDRELGEPHISDWLQAYELALICRDNADDHYLRTQHYIYYHPRLWTAETPQPVRIPVAYATVLAALSQRARWPRNKDVKAAVAELLPPALAVLAAVPGDSPWLPRTRIAVQLAAGSDATEEFADALAERVNRRRIAWDLLALAALAHDLRLPAAVESPFLPTTLREWKR